MERDFYNRLADEALAGHPPSRERCEQILRDPEVELLPLLQAAYEVRTARHGKDVTLHILNNAQNGLCPEDCSYCAQAKSADTDIAEYRLKPDAEILDEAKRAYEAGAHRYCMVFAGRGPSKQRVEKLSSLIREIKTRYPIEVCVSPGLVDDEGAVALKAAGLDRLNHNLNTSEEHYPSICSTHTFADRVRTLQAAQNAGLQTCSGVIIGMGETDAGLVDLAYRLREFKVESLPINFLMEIDGTELETSGRELPELTPEFCLRALCMFRFVNPDTELRAAAGRELHLRSMEVMCLYAANSIFIDGYLNTRGNERARTLQMIKDAGFTIRSEYPLETLLGGESNTVTDVDAPPMKSEQDLRPVRG